MRTVAQKPAPTSPPAEGAEGEGRVVFMFGDSSGDPSRSAKSIKNGRYYTVCTITIGATEACRVDSLIRDLKRRHFPNRHPDSIELHGGALKRELGAYTRDGNEAAKKFCDIYDSIVEIVCGMDAMVNIVVVDKEPARGQEDTCGWNTGHGMPPRPCLERPWAPLAALLLEWRCLTSMILPLAPQCAKP